MTNKPKIKLDTGSKSQSDKMHLGKEIGSEMNVDPNPAVAGAGAKLLTPSNNMETINTNRNKLSSDVEDLTDDLNDEEKIWDERYAKAAQVAMNEYPNDDGKWEGYGFEKADVELTKRPKPEKVTNLQVSPGDAVGEADLIWNPLGSEVVDGYYIQINTTDPIDHNEWRSADPISVSPSKATIVGLTTGQKYWVRVIGFVPAGKGTPSDPKAFIAP